jgi:ApeA-like protein
MSIFDKTLFEDFQLKGEWWLPQEPERKVSGTLTVKHGDSLMLELIGRPSDSSLFSEHRDFNPEIILGTSREGVPCTLLKTMKISSGRSFGGPLNPMYSPQFLFLFQHFETTSEMNFQEASLSYTHLEEWIGELPFETEHMGEKRFEGVTVTVRAMHS